MAAYLPRYLWSADFVDAGRDSADRGGTAEEDTDPSRLGPDPCGSLALEGFRRSAENA